MKKFFTITLAVIAAFIFVSCSDGKNLEDLIEVPDTDDTADASETPDQNGTDKDSDKDGDKDDDTTSCPDEINDPTNPTDEPTNPTDEPTNPTDEPTNPTDEPTNPTDEPTNPTDDNDPINPTDDVEPTDDNDQTNPTDDVDPTNDDDPTNPTNDVEPTDDDDQTNPTDDVEPTDDDDPTNPKDDVDPIDDDDPTNPTNDIDPTDDDDPTNDDDPTTPTDPFEKCTEITLTNTELSYYKHSHGSEKYDIFKATYTPNTGSATSDTFYLKFYGLSEYDYTGDYDLTESDKGLSLYVNEDEYCDSYSGDCTHGKTYFQKAGTVKVISAEFNFAVTEMNLLSAKLNGVVLEETGTNESAKACLKIKDDPTVEYHWYYY